MLAGERQGSWDGSGSRPVDQHERRQSGILLGAFRTRERGGLVKGLITRAAAARAGRHGVAGAVRRCLRRQAGITLAVGLAQDPPLRRYLSGEPFGSTTSTAAGRASTALADADPAHTTQVNQAGTPFHVPAAERRQPHARRRCRATLHEHDDAAVHAATSRTRRSGSTTTSRPTDTTCPAPGVSAPFGVLKGSGPAGRLHARPGPSLLPGAVPARRRQAGPLHDRLRRSGSRRWATTTRASCPSTNICMAGTIRATRSPTPSSRHRSAARSSTTSG